MCKCNEMMSVHTPIEIQTSSLSFFAAAAWCYLYRMQYMYDEIYQPPRDIFTSVEKAIL